MNLKKIKNRTYLKLKKKKGYWRYLSEEHEIGRKMGIGDMTRKKNVYR